MQVDLHIHDRYQVELKCNYSLPHNCRTSAYELDLYLFAPENLNVNRTTYPKQQFYKDLQSRICLQPPIVPLRQLIDDNTNPLKTLRARIELIAQQPQQKPPPDYEVQVKMFCGLARNAIRDMVLYIQEISHHQDRQHLISEYTESVQKLTSAYRALRHILQAPGVDSRILDIYFFGDEYISLLVEDYTSLLHESIDKSNTTATQASMDLLLSVVRDEVQYRHSRKYPSIPDKESDNEVLLYRKSVLKKFVASILFLDYETKKAGQVLEHAFLGFAAAIAMIFATAIAFLSKSLWEALTLPLFIALVVSYVLKDRLKDILKCYWSRGITRHLFDHTTRIHDAQRNRVGKCREGCTFVPDSKIPRNIHKLRDRQHITEIENGWMGEQVLLYRKRVRLFPKRIRHIFTHYSVDGLKDVIRFNVQEFLRKMDNPKKALWVMDEEGLLPVKGTRVYHLNLIVGCHHDEVSSISRYRIVFNRKGIRRIEPVTKP